MELGSKSGYSSRGWNTETKLFNVMTDHRRRCVCGHTITTLPPSKRHKDYIECNYCHRRVYKDEQKQLAHEEKMKREEFRVNIWRKLCG